LLGKKLNDKLAKEILNDTTDMKLTIARKYLDLIDNPAEWTFNKNYFLEQYFSECFFHFAYSVIEILQHEIEAYLRFIPLVKSRLVFLNSDGTEKEKFVDKKFPKYYLSEFMTKLKRSKKPECQKLYPIFLNYFTPPRKIGNKWDFSNSKLWMLREIRNHVAHQPVLTRHANVVVGEGASNIWFAFRFELAKSKRARAAFEIAVLHNNPRDFFEDLFQNLISFRSDVRKIIPLKISSSQYKSPPNFGQKF